MNFGNSYIEVEKGPPGGQVECCKSLRFADDGTIITINIVLSRYYPKEEEGNILLSHRFGA